MDATINRELAVLRQLTAAAPGGGDVLVTSQDGGAAIFSASNGHALIGRRVLSGSTWALRRTRMAGSFTYGHIADLKRLIDQQWDRGAESGARWRVAQRRDGAHRSQDRGGLSSVRYR
jgi:hypothetical protein